MKSPRAALFYYHLSIVHRSKKDRMNRVDREMIDAMLENNLSEVRRFLSVGADVNAKTSNDNTPLRLASMTGHVQVVKQLLDHGADTEAKDSIGLTPLHFACRVGRLSFVNELVSPNDSKNATTTILGKR
jgi:ankyrin repeat protein